MIGCYVINRKYGEQVQGTLVAIVTGGAIHVNSGVSQLIPTGVILNSWGKFGSYPMDELEVIEKKEES